MEIRWRSGRAYSQDLRDKVMAAFDAGEPAREVAERFSVRVSFIYKADLRRRRTGETTAGAALPACAAARGAARGDPRPRGAASGCDDGRSCGSDW